MGGTWNRRLNLILLMPQPIGDQNTRLQMNTHSAEIEKIVEVVLQRLQSTTALSGSDITEPVDDSDTVTTSNNSVLQVANRVVTLVDLEPRLKDVNVLQVSASAVLTPAVVDELRNRDIQLDRTLPVKNVGSPDHDLLMVAPPLQLNGLIGVTKPERSSIDETVQEIVLHQQVKNGSAIWLATSPYAAVCAAGRRTALRVVRLGSSGELRQAVTECQPNVLVVDAAKWSSQAIVALADLWRRIA